MKKNQINCMKEFNKMQLKQKKISKKERKLIYTFFIDNVKYLFCTGKIEN